MFKVNGAFTVDERLYLTKPPIWLRRMPHQHAGLKIRLHSSLHERIAMSDKTDLAALLGSRICHDLISPIGAIGNGLELLMMDPGTHGPEMSLISESVGHANARQQHPVATLP